MEGGGRILFFLFFFFFFSSSFSFPFSLFFFSSLPGPEFAEGGREAERERDKETVYGYLCIHVYSYYDLLARWLVL